MTLNQLLAESVMTGPSMLAMTLSDFSDAEMLVRPVPTANHATWQLGHLIKSAHGMLTGCGAPLAPLPAGFSDKYTNDSAKSDDPARFGKKAELLALLTQISQTSADWAKSLSPAQLAQPSPEELRSFCPTVAAAINLQSSHIAMHMGQIQVIRRKLGKPILF